MNVLKLFFVHEKLASAQLRESTKCCQAYKLFHQINQNCQKAKTNIIKVRETYKGLGGNFSRFGSVLSLFAHAAGLLQKPCFALYKLYIGKKCWQGPAIHHTPCALQAKIQMSTTSWFSIWKVFQNFNRFGEMITYFFCTIIAFFQITTSLKMSECFRWQNATRTDYKYVFTQNLWVNICSNF